MKSCPLTVSLTEVCTALVMLACISISLSLQKLMMNMLFDNKRDCLIVFVLLLIKGTINTTNEKTVIIHLLDIFFFYSSV